MYQPNQSGRIIVIRTTLELGFDPRTSTSRLTGVAFSSRGINVAEEYAWITPFIRTPNIPLRIRLKKGIIHTRNFFEIHIGRFGQFTSIVPLPACVISNNLLLMITNRKCWHRSIRRFWRYSRLWWRNWTVYRCKAHFPSATFCIGSLGTSLTTSHGITVTCTAHVLQCILCPSMLLLLVVVMFILLIKVYWNILHHQRRRRRHILDAVDKEGYGGEKE
mmetsp:Transcript_9790/g.20709  ORF Transcript_9790/g.20709 Transcript_9790/m.20709 type:complete len:219 (-) Transcript_9790:269-925(-)